MYRGFLSLALVLQRIAQAIVGFGIVRSELQRSPVTGDCFRGLALLSQHITEVAVCLGAVLFIQVTVEPAVTRMGSGLKHQGAAPEQSTI